MSYKIAIASSDEIHIDESFGSAKVFHIFEVTDGTYVKSEDRIVVEETETPEKAAVTQESCGNSGGCGNNGCHTRTGGCSGNEGTSSKVELISDCRCIVCKKIGFHVQKQLERRAITSFGVDCSVEEALNKISSYFQKVDTHQSLRGSST